MVIAGCGFSGTGFELGGVGEGGLCYCNPVRIGEWWAAVVSPSANRTLSSGLHQLACGIDFSTRAHGASRRQWCGLVSLGGSNGGRVFLRSRKQEARLDRETASPPQRLGRHIGMLWLRLRSYSTVRCWLPGDAPAQARRDHEASRFSIIKTLLGAGDERSPHDRQDQLAP